MKSVRLYNKVEIPAVGFGLWKNVIPGVVNKSVKTALGAGYTHFDSAQIYFNERFLRNALQKADVDRKDVFITTKIWNSNQPDGKFQKSLEKSLKKLDTDYVDLLLLHFPVTKTRQQAWKLMETAYKEGKAKSIGVSNYTISHLEELMNESSVKPMVNQVELHVFLQQRRTISSLKHIRH